MDRCLFSTKTIKSTQTSTLCEASNWCYQLGPIENANLLRESFSDALLERQMGRKRQRKLLQRERANIDEAWALGEMVGREDDKGDGARRFGFRGDFNTTASLYTPTALWIFFRFFLPFLFSHSFFLHLEKSLIPREVSQTHSTSSLYGEIEILNSRREYRKQFESFCVTVEPNREQSWTIELRIGEI